MFTRTMGIIDVNIEKPALKREETSEAESESATEATQGRGGMRSRVLRAGGAFIAAVVGVLTLRKIRERRRQG